MVCLTCSTVATSSDIKRGTGWVRLSGVRLEAKTNPNDKVTPMQIAGRSIPLPEQIQDFLRTEHVTRYERELYYFSCQSCCKRMWYTNPHGLKSIVRQPESLVHGPQPFLAAEKEVHVIGHWLEINRAWARDISQQQSPLATAVGPGDPPCSASASASASGVGRERSASAERTVVEEPPHSRARVAGAHDSPTRMAVTP